MAAVVIEDRKQLISFPYPKRGRKNVKYEKENVHTFQTLFYPGNSPESLGLFKIKRKSLVNAFLSVNIKNDDVETFFKLHWSKKV